MTTFKLDSYYVKIKGTNLFYCGKNKIGGHRWQRWDQHRPKMCWDGYLSASFKAQELKKDYPDKEFVVVNLQLVEVDGH